MTEHARKYKTERFWLDLFDSFKKLKKLKTFMEPYKTLKHRQMEIIIKSKLFRLETLPKLLLP